MRCGPRVVDVFSGDIGRDLKAGGSSLITVSQSDVEAVKKLVINYPDPSTPSILKRIFGKTDEFTRHDTTNSFVHDY